MRSTLIACIALAARVAAADSPPPDPPVAPAVPPDQVGGITVDDDRSSAARGVGRVALYPIRLGAQIVLAPLRGGAWLVERYQARSTSLVEPGKHIVTVDTTFESPEQMSSATVILKVDGQEVSKVVVARTVPVAFTAS